MSLIFGLFVTTFLLFARAGGNGFVALDDQQYITQNAHVQAGLCWPTFLWAMRNVDALNWHPLTWLSIALDCELFGLHPAGHHMTSAALHAASASLLCILLLRICRSPWTSAFCGAAFAWHPLRVESVVWAAERKDVLATFFLLLSVLAYLPYVKHRTPQAYLVLVSCYVLGVLSKPMLVTLPALLLLLDYWPLNRFEGLTPRPFRSRVLEKLPLFVVAIAAGAVALFAEHHGGSMLGLSGIYSFSHRISNALVSIISYLQKTVFPMDLIYFYLPAPHIPLWQSVCSTVAIVLLTAGCVHQRHARPWLLVGWLWFLISLLPVIGLVQVGQQSMADRYSYIPSIGLAMALCAAVTELKDRSSLPIWALPTIGGITLLALAATTFHQIGYWKDSITLFSHAVDVAPENWFAQGAIGEALAASGRDSEAVEHLATAEQLHPGDATVEYELGNLLLKGGDDSSAEEMFARSACKSPAFADPHYNWANLLVKHGELAEAVHHYQFYLQANPLDARAHNNLGVVFAQMGRNDQQAIAEFSEALRLDPTMTSAKQNIARLRSAAHTQLPWPSNSSAL